MNQEILKKLKSTPELSPDVHDGSYELVHTIVSAYRDVNEATLDYRCDATQVTTIDFDRNKIRGMATALSKRADEISMSLDKCLVNTEVSYEPPFDMNDSFEDILSDFIEKSTAA